MVQDTYMETYGDSALAATITHLKRDLIHAIWELLLNDKFMHAYEHGIVLKCADGIFRRLFPRFFTYSADSLKSPSSPILLIIDADSSLNVCESPSRNNPEPC